MTPVAEMRAVAADPNAPREELLRLAHGSPMVQHALARNPACPGEALDAIADSLDERCDHWGWVAKVTLDAVAAHPNASATLIARMADHPSPFAGMAVGRNPSASLAVLEGVVRRWGAPGRSSVAQNPALPPDWLARLARDPAAEVRFGAIRNPSLSGDDLARMAGDHSSLVRDEAVPRILRAGHDVLRDALLRNGEGTRRRLVRDLHPATALRLADDHDVRLRRVLADHTRDPAVLTVLASDGDVIVRRRAGRRVLEALGKCL